MSERHAFDGILALLHEAMLDDSRWLSTSGLFDDACRTKGNMLTFAEGQTHQDVEIFYVRFCFRGEQNKDLEREYFENYYPWDERVPRLRKLPDGQIVHTSDLYTEQERKTSLAFNEVVPVGSTQNGLSVRLDGPGGSRIVWTICDPADGDDWSSDQLDMIRRLLPHIRQFVRVRQAVADAGAAGSSLAGLLDNTRFGIIQLARRGQIVAVNDPARDFLRKGDGLCDRGGFLHARSPDDDDHLQKLLACALPGTGEQGTSASMLVNRRSAMPRLVLHVSPVSGGRMGFRPRHVAALVLVVDPARRARIDPELVMVALDLTPAESQVAAMLAEGRTPRNIAAATGCRESTIRWHIQKIFVKHGISRQVELVRLVSPLAGVPRSGRSDH